MPSDGGIAFNELELEDAPGSLPPPDAALQVRADCLLAAHPNQGLGPSPGGSLVPISAEGLCQISGLRDEGISERGCSAFGVVGVSGVFEVCSLLLWS